MLSADSIWRFVVDLRFIVVLVGDWIVFWVKICSRWLLLFALKEERRVLPLTFFNSKSRTCSLKLFILHCDLLRTWEAARLFVQRKYFCEDLAASCFGIGVGARLAGSTRHSEIFRYNFDKAILPAQSALQLRANNGWIVQLVEFLLWAYNSECKRSWVQIPVQPRYLFATDSYIF